MIEGVIVRPYPLDPSWSNSRPQRDLVCYINGDPDLMRYFHLQIKKLKHREVDFLGRQGHYHNYAELYMVEQGEVTFDLWDKASGDKTRHAVLAGNLILIPPGVAHRAYASADLIMLAITQEPYKSGADIPADFEPLGPLPYRLEEI